MLATDIQEKYGKEVNINGTDRFQNDKPNKYFRILNGICFIAQVRMDHGAYVHI